MKKLVLFTVLIAILAIAGAAMAGEALFPRTDGNDVILPNNLFTSATGYVANETVYAACDINGWLSRGADFETADNLKATTVVKEKDGWRAKGMKGVHFSLAQKVKGKVIWIKAERVLVFPKQGFKNDFIDWSRTPLTDHGPAFKVGEL